MKEVKRTLLEFLAIVAAGLGIGLAANAISPEGLSLSTNLFPKHERTEGPGSQPANGHVTANAADSRPTTGPEPGHVVDEATAIRLLKEQGFQALSHDEMVADFKSPYYNDNGVYTGVYIIVDARMDKPYAEGHIPGAYQFDHVKPDKYLPTIKKADELATKIVLYCNGGDCQDSEYAYEALVNAGIDPSKLFIYAGGMTLWQERKQPVERGQRDSKDLIPGNGK